MNESRQDVEEWKARQHHAKPSPKPLPTTPPSPPPPSNNDDADEGSWGMTQTIKGEWR